MINSRFKQNGSVGQSSVRSLFRSGQLRFLLLFLSILPFLGIHASAWAGKYRQPAYISNAYFSDKMAEQGGETIQPLAVVKALRTRPTGVVGYFILDLILAHKGTHHFKVNIINQDGEKITDLVYAPVKSTQAETLPLYTAAGAISGEFSPGLWFFKVYDRVGNGNWQPLGAFSIMLLDPDRVSRPGNKQKRRADKIKKTAKKASAKKSQKGPRPKLKANAKQKTKINARPKAKVKKAKSKSKKAKVRSKKVKTRTKKKKSKARTKVKKTRAKVNSNTPVNIATKKPDPVVAPKEKITYRTPTRRFAVPMDY